MKAILSKEAELANFISEKLESIALKANNSSNLNEAELKSALNNDLLKLRQSLNAERKKIMQLELAILEEI